MKEIQDIDLKALIEQETGQRFNKDNKINSPFTNENTPSFSVFFNSNKNKWQFKDFSDSGKYGDALDFVMEYKNLSHKEAREYLGMEVTRTPIEEFKSTIEDYVSKQIKSGNKQGYEPLGTFVFVDENNNPIYAKVKFLKPDGKKKTPYYSIQNGQVFNKRQPIEEVPYNYYNLLQGIAQNKTIVPLEGEKDVNTINNMLSKKDYVATSFKGFKDFDKIKGEFMKIAVIGDTGVAGQKYIDNIRFNFLKDSSSFKIINLPGIKSLGDNKDVTDWLEAGHTKKELLNAFDRSLDLKNFKELQQDYIGVYSSHLNEKTKEYDTTYLTNFNVLEATKGYNVDRNEEQIILKLRNNKLNKTEEKIDSSKIFSDPKKFRDFLGLDFSFKGSRINELIKLKDWIVEFFATEDKRIYEGNRFLPLENGKFELVTSKGAISSDSVDNSKIAINDSVDLDIEEISKEELKELMQYLFRFLEHNQSLSIIGSIAGFLEVGQNIAIDKKLHHLCLFGEAQSGKSTILEEIILPILNIKKQEKRSASSSMASLNTLCSSGNYPLAVDEYKPSEMSKNKLSDLANLFRILYDRTTSSRGTKDFEIKDFYLERPLILVGEECFPNASKSLMTRCCIVYMSESGQKAETTNAINYLISHKQQLRKLGKSLTLEALNLPIEEYKTLRDELNDKFTLKARPLNTAINIACGVELLNKVLIKHGLQPIEDYYSEIEKNIVEDVLEGEEDSRSVIERMILLFNDIIQDNNYWFAKHAIKIEDDKTYIRSQILVDSLHKYSRDFNSVDITLLKIKDFKKQAKKAGYIVKPCAKQFRDKDTGTNAQYDLYDTDKLKSLQADSILNVLEDDNHLEPITAKEQNLLDDWEKK